MARAEETMQLEVRDQVRLSFKRLLEVCLDSISYRLMRSIVTVAIIVLAIAFLAVIMADGYLGRSVRDAVMAKTRSMTAYTSFLLAVGGIEPDDKLIASITPLTKGTAPFANVAGWGDMNEEQMLQFVGDSRRVNAYLAFFDGLSVGRRIRLVGQKTGLDIFDWLLDPANMTAFSQSLAQFKSLRLPEGSAGLAQFLSAWPAYRDRLALVRKNYAETIRKIAEYCSPDDVGAKLRKAIDAGQTAPFFTDIAGRGFHVAEATWADIQAGIAYKDRWDWAVSQLNKPPVKTGWNRQYDEVFSQNSALESCATSPSRIAWIENALKEAREDKGFDAARFRAVANEYHYRNQMDSREKRLVGKYGHTVTLSQKTIWLIFVSFLVCVVGIANAMLMSVLERFKEIATMKCLGARNQTIAFLFVTESVIIGVVGGVAGIVLGVVVVMLRMMIEYRSLVFTNFPTPDILTTFGVCFLCSLLLAAVAAIYPAWVASRMAPMEAMRVD